MLRQIISGGQTGADLAGLRAAHACGFLTGGWMPRGFLTLEGPRPELAARFGMQEHTSANYPPRTRRNVQAACATLRFARQWHSPGERVTLKFLRHYGKPFCDIDMATPPPEADLARWLIRQRVQILNIAGNAEQTAPGIEEWAYAYLVRVLTLYRETA